MTSLIKNVFEQVCTSVSFDQRLTMVLHRYQVGFVNKNKEHTEFFGGNLTGVQVVRFIDSDKYKWFEEVLDADEEELREKLHQIAALRNDNGVFQVAGNPMNLSVAWMIHRLHNAKELPVAVRQQAMEDALLILQFKFITSLLFRYFRYPANRAVAEATYAMLTNKYSIKIHGTWLAVLRNRAKDVIANSSIHFNTIAKMDSDEGVVRMVNDIQGRIREMLKNIYGVFLKTHASGSKIHSSASVVEHDGVEILRDQTRGLTTYTRYLKSVVGDRNSFVRQELLGVMEKIMPSAPPKHTLAALEYLSANFLRTKSDRVDEIIDMTLVHSFAYLASNRVSIRANVDLAGLLTRLKGVYTSSRSTDPELLELRAMMEHLVRRAIDSRTDAVVASVRTAVLLYLVARAFTMRHYTQL